MMDSAGSHILKKIVPPNKSELKKAQKFLEYALRTNQLEFFKAHDILANPFYSSKARMAASLQIKNTLTSTNTVKQQFQQRWLVVHEHIRHHVKQNALKRLGTETKRPSSTAQYVAFIAAIELPLNAWPEVIRVLCSNIITNSSTDAIRKASLEAIVYICQNIDQDCSTQHLNYILKEIVYGMRKKDSNRDVRLAAITTLLNLLEFTKRNFEKKMELDHILQVVCEITRSTDTQIRVTALKCLVKIMSLYYQYMEVYVAQVLLPITLEAIRSDIDEISFQGIEFWSNVSDKEVDLARERHEATKLGKPPLRISRFYAKGALPHLVPVLIQKLVQQDELNEKYKWKPSAAASVCLTLLVSCCEEDVVSYVLPFFEENIKNIDWRYRYASLMAFVSILDGLRLDTMELLVENNMPTIIQLLYDSRALVREAATWTICCICKLAPETVINKEYLSILPSTRLANDLIVNPEIGANVYQAYRYLATASYEAGTICDHGDQLIDRMFKYFDLLVQKLLLERTNRNDAQANLCFAAYTALMIMTKNSQLDCYASVQHITTIVERLNQVLALEGQLHTWSDRVLVNQLQGLLCNTLKSVLKKVMPLDVPQISDRIMISLLRTFSWNFKKSAGIQEDVLFTVVTLIKVLDTGFLKYMNWFKPFLFLGLENYVQHHVCIAATIVVGILCRVLKVAMLPYCDEIIRLLWTNLSNDSVHCTVKAHILATLGDIAFAIGPAYQKYLKATVTMIVQVYQIQVDRNGNDIAEHFNELRRSILVAYTGIIESLGKQSRTINPSLSIIELHVPFMMKLVKNIVDEKDDDNVTRAAANLVGHLGARFADKIIPSLETDAIIHLLIQACQSRNKKTRKISQWAWVKLHEIVKKSNWIRLVKSHVPKLHAICTKENLLTVLLNWNQDDGFILPLCYEEFLKIHSKIELTIGQKDMISTEVKLAITLRYVATNVSFITLEFLSGVSVICISQFLPKLQEVVYISTPKYLQN